MLPLVSEQRRQQALRYTHTFGQFCCLKSYCMLQELVASVSPTLDGKPLTFAYNEYGKPEIDLSNMPDVSKEAKVYFSISHTKNAILVAIANEPIGVDIEQVRVPSEGLVEKTMNAAEQAMIARSGEQKADAANGKAIAFTSLWTQKEAVLKWRGTGILDDLHNVLAADDVRVEARVAPHGAFCYAFAVRKSTQI